MIDGSGQPVAGKIDGVLHLRGAASTSSVPENRSE